MVVAFDSKTIEQLHLGKSLIQKLTITANGAHYFALRIGYHTMITINKATSVVTLNMTNDFNATSVDSAIFGLLQSEGADDYHKGHTAGFTGCKVEMTTDNGDTEVVIMQYLLGD